MGSVKVTMTDGSTSTRAEKGSPEYSMAIRAFVHNAPNLVAKIVEELGLVEDVTIISEGGETEQHVSLGFRGDVKEIVDTHFKNKEQADESGE